MLVALQQNAQKRANDAVQEELNAFAAFMLDDNDRTRSELRAAVGLEDRESS